MNNDTLNDWLRVTELKVEVLSIVQALIEDEVYTREDAVKGLLKVATNLNYMEDVHFRRGSYGDKGKTVLLKEFSNG